MRGRGLCDIMRGMEKIATDSYSFEKLRYEDVVRDGKTLHVFFC